MPNDEGAVCGAHEVAHDRDSLVGDATSPCGEPAPEHGLTIEQALPSGVTFTRLPLCERHYLALKERMGVADGERVAALGVPTAGGNGRG